jgi:hypothetical protein
MTPNNEHLTKLTTEFLKTRWRKDWESHLEKHNVQKWKSRIGSILMGFYEEFKLFDTSSRRAFYKVLRKNKLNKIAKELANYMRSESNRNRKYKY